jgi:hypothetical protein
VTVAVNAGNVVVGGGVLPAVVVMLLSVLVMT